MGAEGPAQAQTIARIGESIVSKPPKSPAFAAPGGPARFAGERLESLGDRPEPRRMTKLEIAALFAGLNLLILVVLGLRVANYRRANRIGLGDGGDPALLRAIRQHGNAAEYIPAGMIGLMFIALLDPVPLWCVELAGAALTIGRLLHPLGLAQSEGVSFGRVAGMMLTFLALLICALGAIWGAAAPLL
jgi:uncharacterized membrane protein YecN with MAPEG domain